MDACRFIINENRIITMTLFFAGVLTGTMAKSFDSGVEHAAIGSFILCATLFGIHRIFRIIRKKRFGWKYDVDFIIPHIHRVTKEHNIYEALMKYQTASDREIRKSMESIKENYTSHGMVIYAMLFIILAVINAMI